MGNEPTDVFHQMRGRHTKRDGRKKNICTKEDVKNFSEICQLILRLLSENFEGQRKKHGRPVTEEKERKKSS